MGAFTYTAVDERGQQATGTVGADSRAAAVEQVCRMGL
jgi:type II secretory pathway component PulF